MSGLRVFPNMDVMRPADPEETAAAYAAALDRKDGPTALILTRQNVRTLKEIPVRNWRRAVPGLVLRAQQFGVTMFWFDVCRGPC